MRRKRKTPSVVGYVLKCYPRYSETFVVNEILSHEAAGLEVQVFSLLPAESGHFQEIIGEVRAPVQYIRPLDESSEFWQTLEEASTLIPDLFTKLEISSGQQFKYISQALQLAKIVRLKGIEHLHAHFASAATTVTRIASYLSGVPYSFTAHAKDIYHENVDIDDLRRKICDASAVITVGDYNLDYLRSLFGSDGVKVKRIYNGLDLRRFTFRASQKRNRTIVSVGRLVEKKGFHVLIDACDILASRDCKFKCQIIGDGPLEQELRAYVERIGLQDKVELLGALPRKDVIKHVEDAAAFAAPSVIGQDGDRDGLPTTILESMAIGTPVVSTDVTGIPEVVKDGKTGLMVPQQDASALADALQKLLASPSLRVSLAKNARKLIESRFNIQRNTKQLREMFAQAAKDHKHLN